MGCSQEWRKQDWADAEAELLSSHIKASAQPYRGSRAELAIQSYPTLKHGGQVSVPRIAQLRAALGDGTRAVKGDFLPLKAIPGERLSWEPPGANA